MRILCLFLTTLLLALLIGNGLAADPSGATGETSLGTGTDLEPNVTWNKIEMLERRANYLREHGRTSEALELENLIEEMAPRAIDVPEREEILPELHGGVTQSGRSGASMIAVSPWAQDHLIYQGSYSYSAWATTEIGLPYDVDYDSVGNIYAAVALADSTVHLYESTDNGVTWTDELMLVPNPKNYIGNVRVLVSDDGDSSLIYLFYLWTGDGGNLWCAVVNTADWSLLRAEMLDASPSDSVYDFSVTRDHYWGEDYLLYADYQVGAGDANIYFTWSDDHGASWDPPSLTQLNSGDTYLAYGGYSLGGNLYRAYVGFPSDPDSSDIRVRRSDTYGQSWDPSVIVRNNLAGDNSNPRVAAAHTPRAGQAVWSTYTTDFMNSGNLQIWCSFSGDGGQNWGTRNGPSYDADADEFGSSIVVHRSDGNDVFHLAYMYDDTATTTLDSIRVQTTAADTWPGPTESVGINDSAFAFNCGPIATYSSGLPGVAYGGAAGVNVYYDNAWNTGAQESVIRTRNLSFALLQNRPNPFSERTAIHFTLPARTDVSVRIYDVAGRLVKNLVDETKNAGAHMAVWDGTDETGSRVSNGVYFYRLSSGNGIRTRKLNLVR